MKLVLLLSIFISMSAFAQTIECGDGSCYFDPDLDIRDDVNSGSFTQFEVRDLIDQLNIITTPNATPRNVKFTYSSIEGETNNLLLNLRSLKLGASGGSAIAIGSKTKNLTIDVTGRTGENSPNASFVCANKILNGEFGEAIKSRFITDRINNPLLPADQCTSADLTSIQGNQFACEEGFTEFNGEKISANRWTPRRDCQSQSERNICVQKRMRITCSWLAETFPAKTSCSPTSPEGSDVLNPRPRGHGAGGKQWTCDPAVASSSASGWKIVFDPFVRDEAWVASRRLAGMTDEDICDELTGRHDSYFDGYKEITKNGFEDRNYDFFETKPDSVLVDKTSLTVSRGFYQSYTTSSGTTNNPRVRIPMPATGHVLDVETSPCDAQGVRSSGEFVSRLMNSNCRRPGLLNIAQYTQNNVHLSDGHTYQSWERQTYWSVMCSAGSTRGHECYNCQLNSLYSGAFIDCLSTSTYTTRRVLGNIGASANQYYNFNVRGMIASILSSDIKIIPTDFTYRYRRGYWKSSCCFKTKRKWRDGSRVDNTPRFYVFKSAYSRFPVGENLVPVDFRKIVQPFPAGQNLSGSNQTPTEIRCSVLNDRNVDCSNSTMGINFGVRYDLKVKFYAPNGRIIDYYVQYSVGRGN